MKEPSGEWRIRVTFCRRPWWGLGLIHASDGFEATKHGTESEILADLAKMPVPTKSKRTIEILSRP